MGDLSEFVDRINDISLEVDYGMQYMISSLHDGRTFHSGCFWREKHRTSHAHASGSGCGC